MPSAQHLQQHQYTVAPGAEPLAKRPLSLRLYANDDAAVRAMEKAGRLFVRQAVRDALANVATT
tara:strand:+ start:123 stop:314 length:192 start_codon:yes stop_codon:yes gene_type:complete